MKEETKITDLKFEKFDPKKDLEDKLPDSPGNYIVVLRKTAKMPDAAVTPVYKSYMGYDVVYTGISSKSLRERDYKHHFTGNNAGRSTLRKSLGCLMGFKQIPRDNKKDNKKTKFGEKDEERLSDWMKENLLLFFSSQKDVKTLEERLIKEFNPPLNIQKNKEGKNKEYVAMLRSLRNTK